MFLQDILQNKIFHLYNIFLFEINLTFELLFQKIYHYKYQIFFIKFILIHTICLDLNKIITITKFYKSFSKLLFFSILTIFIFYKNIIKFYLNNFTFEFKIWLTFRI